jgi:uncharacterized protein Yka (UPF0111/DUF47 family)
MRTVISSNAYRNANPPMKSQIIAQLGQADLLLPTLIAEGLAANDRIKVRMSALQAAAHHARDPGRPVLDLGPECHAAGLDASAVMALVGRAHLSADGRIAAPDLGRLIEGAIEDARTMIRAVAAGAPPEGEAAEARLAAAAEASSRAGDEIEGAAIARLTGLSEGGGDSLHRLVMDLHKVLNRLAGACAEEIMAGAHVYGLAPDDRPPVEAFMRGIDETRDLKFDHPGLGTTATRSGSRLIIQNDIGATDAHVVVVAVEGNAVTLTYTDVHLARAKFFMALFDAFAARWSGLDRKSVDGLGEDGVFYLVTGRYEAESPERRNDFLAAVGTGLVFLIDWNKARKVLRGWVSNGDSIRILDWAARRRIGHRALLELGGAELVAAAVRHAAPKRIGFGERLDVVLGRDNTVDFLKSVLRISTHALLQGQSIRLARDHVEAELARHLERVDGALLAIVVRQAGLAHDIAAAISRCICDLQSGQPVDGAALARRARHMEEKADRILIEARGEIARFDGGATIEQLVNRIEEAVDELEQAAFIASLLPERVDPAALAVLAKLCAAAVAGAKAAASGVAAASEAPEGRRADFEDALAAVGRLIDVEHMADDYEREITALTFQGGTDLRASLSVLELARAIERATDRLAGFGHLLSRHMLEDLST